MHKFRELKVWQRAMDLVVGVYRLTRTFPSEKRFGLTSQLRRAATSIPLNISEGAGDSSKAEFQRFLRIALRSCYETMTALEIAHRLDYCQDSHLNAQGQQADEIAAMLVGLMRSISSNQQRSI